MYDGRSCTYNFGQEGTFNGQVSAGNNSDENDIGNFKYAPPSGFLALCSKNLPDTDIKQGDKHFDILYFTLWKQNQIHLLLICPMCPCNIWNTDR